VSDTRLLSVLIPAVGGQGGGVLSEWIVEAADVAGLLAHGTSIPGVAQRTGSTTYYIELYGGDHADEPAFSLYPVPGALDVLLAPEFMEVGRAIELGFVSGATTVIASTHRLYTIHEKIATGRAIYPFEQLASAARAAARSVLAFDALAVAREHRTEANAVLLGALAGSAATPIPPDAFRDAIRRKGVMVESNLKGFQIGLERGRAESGSVGPGASSPSVPAPLSRVNGAGDAFAADVERFPETLRPVIAEALARLVDYQDAAYARRYLARLAAFVAPGHDPELSRLVARSLAVWMTYEDAIRVAQLKTRSARFERIRRDAGAPGAEVVVTDYLKPDLDEIYGILPRRLVAPLARWAERRWPHGRPTFGQHVKSTTVSGYLRLWVLARMRRLRPISHRAHEEHVRIDRWLAAVQESAALDTTLPCEIARFAQLVKGYGEVRRRLVAVVDDALDQLLRAARLEAAGGTPPEVTTELARRYRELVLQGPDGEPRAAALAHDVVTHLQCHDRAAARATLVGR
jgi:indolepyruvate ferredoxin oxidoreductase beta subunit